MNYIHTVTTVSHQAGAQDLQRCWGFYLTREEAIKGMHRSVDDECGYYNYCVIERFHDGIYTTADQEQWFSFEPTEKRWIECEKPSFSVDVINYGIG